MLALILCGIASTPLSARIDYVVPFRPPFGPFAAFAAVMMWFFVTAYAVLPGAELNAQLVSGKADLRERASTAGNNIADARNAGG